MTKETMKGFWEKLKYNRTRCATCKKALPKARQQFSINRCFTCEKAYNEGYERMREKVITFANRGDVQV